MYYNSIRCLASFYIIFCEKWASYCDLAKYVGYTINSIVRRKWPDWQYRVYGNFCYIKSNFSVMWFIRPSLDKLASFISCLDFSCPTHWGGSTSDGARHWPNFSSSNKLQTLCFNLNKGPLSKTSKWSRIKKYIPPLLVHLLSFCIISIGFFTIWIPICSLIMVERSLFWD